MEYYSYLWLREDGTPYYAGKGTGKRAFVRGSHHCYPPKDRSRILVFPMLTEAEAMESEIAMIELFGRKDLGTGCLRNFTAGGDGSSGYKHTPESLQKMSAVHAGKRHSPATEFTSATWKGKKREPFSEEHRQRLSESKTGKNLGHPNYHSAAGDEKIRQSKLGTKASLETRQRMGASQKLAWLKRKAQGTVQLSNS